MIFGLSSVINFLKIEMRPGFATEAIMRSALGEVLEATGRSLDRVILFDSPDEELVRRLGECCRTWSAGGSPSK